MFVCASTSLFAAVPALAQDNAAPVIAPPPGWVQLGSLRSGKQDVPPAQANAPLAILSNDQQIRFGRDFDERYVSSEIKVQTPQGLAAVGTIAIPWKPDSGTLTVHALKIVRGADTIDVLASGQKFTVLRRERNLEQQTLDGVLTATIQPEGLQVGDVVQFAYTLRLNDPVTKGHSEAVTAGFDGVPGTPVRLRVLWPKDKAVRWRATTGLPTPRVSERADGHELVLAFDAGEKLDPPADAPARYNPVRLMMFSDFASWSDVSRMMAPLYMDAAVIKPGSALAVEAAKIKAATSDPAKQAMLALKLAQDRVRYIYRGMDAGNLMPANAELTWERRFGDCKGKTALLIAILRSLNIAAEPALVSSGLGDGLDQRLPLVGLFDHVLVRTEIAGRVYWIDGTRTGDTTLDSIPVPAVFWALPVRAAGAELERLTLTAPKMPLVDTTIDLDVSRGLITPATAEVTEVHRGDAAIGLKIQLAQLSPSDLDKALREYWKKSYDFIEPDSVGARFDETTGEQHLTLSGEAKMSFEKGGYQLDGAQLGWANKIERKPGHNADAPVSLAYPYWTRFRENIVLPRGGEGFTIDGKDVSQTLGGYQFSRQTAIKGVMVTMEASTRSLSPEIPLAQARADEAALTAMSKVIVRVAASPDYQWTSADMETMNTSTPDSATAFLRRGNIYLDKGDGEKALADFEAAVKLEPDNARAITNRAQAKLQSGQIEGVAAELDKAEKLNPREPVVYNARAQLAEVEGNYAAAIAALTKAIDLWPNNAWALGERVYLNAVVGSASAAFADLDRLAVLSPERTRAVRLETMVLTNRFAEGLAMLAEAEKADPKNDRFKALRARFLIQSGDSVGARAIFAGIRTAAKGNAQTLNNLCWTQAGANFDLPTALVDCQASLKGEKDNTATLDSLALVYHRMGRNTEAVQAYDQVLAKRPKQSSSLYGRGLAKLAMGDQSGAADLKSARQYGRLSEIGYFAMGLGQKPKPAGEQPAPK